MVVAEYFARADLQPLQSQPTLIQAIFEQKISKINSVLCDHINCKTALDAQDAEGRTCMHAAAFVGKEEIVEMLILAGAPVNKTAKKHGETPLHVACRNGHEDVVNMIISHCKDASTTRDKFWRTPMHICAANGSIHCAEILIVPAAETVRNLDRFSATPLHYACAFGHEEMVNFLLDNSADLNMHDKKERRPLHYAAYGGYLDIVQILIRNGADPNLPDVQGWTPLHAAAAGGHADIVKYLLGQIGPAAVLLSAATKEGDTALHIACNNGKSKTVAVLLGFGANTEAQNARELVQIARQTGTSPDMANSLFMAYFDIF